MCVHVFMKESSAQRIGTSEYHTEIWKKGRCTMYMYVYDVYQHHTCTCTCKLILRDKAK